MEDYKEKYNFLLKRYYNGCEYLKNNPEKFEKYLPELLKILEQLDIIIVKYNIKDFKEIEKGF